MIRRLRLLQLLQLLPPLLLAARIRPRTLVGAADRLEVLGGGEVGLALGHRHAGVGGAVLTEGAGVRRRRQGDGAVAAALPRRVQNVLVAARNLAAELDAAGENRGRLVHEDGGRQALGAAQPARLDRRLPLEGGAYGGAVLGAAGGNLRDVGQRPAEKRLNQTSTGIQTLEGRQENSLCVASAVDL